MSKLSKDRLPERIGFSNDGKKDHENLSAQGDLEGDSSPSLASLSGYRKYHFAAAA
jgi:hypothetical protein